VSDSLPADKVGKTDALNRQAFIFSATLMLDETVPRNKLSKKQMKKRAKIGTDTPTTAAAIDEVGWILRPHIRFLFIHPVSSNNLVMHG